MSTYIMAISHVKYVTYIMVIFVTTHAKIISMTWHKENGKMSGNQICELQKMNH